MISLDYLNEISLIIIAYCKVQNFFSLTFFERLFALIWKGVQPALAVPERTTAMFHNKFFRYFPAYPSLQMIKMERAVQFGTKILLKQYHLAEVSNVYHFANRAPVLLL